MDIYLYRLRNIYSDEEEGVIIPLGFLNEMRVDEKTGKVYHEKLFEVRYIGRIPAEMCGNVEKTTEYMIGKGWIRKHVG